MLRATSSLQIRVLLIADYPGDEQKSMRRFAELLVDKLPPTIDVRTLRPSVILACLVVRYPSIRKWLGYVDKYMLFIPKLVLEARKADLIHICDQGNALYLWILRSRPHIITCHDVLAIKSAAGYYSKNQVSWTGRMYQGLISNALMQAARIVCVSKTTAAELLQLGRFTPSQIVVIENGHNYRYAPMDYEKAWARLSKFGLQEDESFFLHVGGNQWYKNRVGVVEIFAQIKTYSLGRPFKLVMAGKEPSPEIRNAISLQRLECDVLVLVDVDNEDLRALYSVSAALIFPSLFEGFGWPVIEAQACGCPVFASAREPLLSIGGSAARYFDPNEVAAASKIVVEGLKDFETMRKDGIENSARFSSEKMAAAYAAEYQDVLNSFHRK